MTSSRKSFADFQDTGWRTGLFRALLIAVLAASATAAPVAVLRALMPWRTSYLMPLACLAALIGVFDTVRLGRPDWRDRRRLAFRLGEILLLLVLAQVVIWSAATGWPTVTELAFWLGHPGAFPAGQLIATGLLVLGAWGLAVAVTGDFLDLAIQPDEVAAHESRSWGDTRSQWRVFRPVGRGDILGRFAQRWVWGGTGLLILAALSGLSVTQDVNTILRFTFSGLRLPPDVVAGLLCYFLAGLLLLSDGRLAMLRGRWYNEEVTVAPGVTRGWYAISGLILLVVAIGALLLPLGPTDWLGRALEWMIMLVMRIVMTLLILLSMLMAVLLYPFRSLLKLGADESTGPLRPPTFDLPAQVDTVRRLPDWLGGVAFWAVVLVVGGYLLAIYLRSSGRLHSFGGIFLLRLRTFWSGRHSRLRQALRVRSAAWRAQRGRHRRLTTPVAARPMRLGELQPREQVRRFYLEAVRRASERGLQRPPHKTPSEFADDLDANWPEAVPDVQVLTGAFVDARYAARDIAPAEAQRAQSAWQRLMATLGRPLGRRAGRP